MTAPGRGTGRYTLREICEIVGIEEHFAAELVAEAVLVADTGEPDHFSERMVERARVARELAQELEINLPGVAVIVRLREEIVDLRRCVSELARRLDDAR